MPTHIPNQTVETQLGRVSGLLSDDGIASFKGIPYAKPPVGALRWCPPVPKEPWDGTIEAHSFAADCHQNKVAAPRLDCGLSQGSGMSEDCLYLNVWTPSAQPDANLPVMVWFPGGGFLQGSAAEPVYDGSALARRDVVVVTVNYRLGAFGFFAHPELSRESENGASGNYGILDVIQALKWIRENIAAFGGDADRVTVFGQSAGGALVTALIVSPLATGLFHRAIAQSPGAFRPLGTLTDAEKIGLEAGEDLGALRNLPAEQILALNANYVPKTRGLTTPRMLRPIVDGWCVPDQETRMLLDGNFNSVPLIIGNCEDEGSLLVGNAAINDRESYRNFVAANFGADTEEALSLYPAERDEDARAAYSQALGDTQFHYAGRSIARSSAAKQKNTYRYLFTHRPGALDAAPEHGHELMYVFGTLDAGCEILKAGSPTEQDHLISEAMQQAWTHFAATGEPGGVLAAWPRYDAESDATLEIGTSGFPTIQGFHKEEHSFLDRFFGFS